MSTTFEDALHLMSFCLLLFILMVSCTQTDRLEVIKERGEALARIHCVTCHDYPEPQLLTRSTWHQILPTMGAKMGLSNTVFEKQHMQLLLANNVEVPLASVTLDEWNDIQTYYLLTSPESLRNPETHIEGQTSLFDFQPYSLSHRPAASLLSFGTMTNELWYGDALSNKLYRLNLSSGDSSVYNLDGAPSFIGSEELAVLTMGRIHPNDLSNGELLAISEDRTKTILSNLPRPVHISTGDLNQDGHRDYVVSGFGHLKGYLAWFEGTDSSFERHILRPLPGAIKTDVLDLDKDGALDILCLMAQGDEGFFLYRGDGKGNFREEKVIAFPSAYGSTYYEIADMNADGLPDIIYTNGDSGDYEEPKLKPYHGVRIFINQGGTDLPDFQEAYFFHMNGPFRAMAEDYDLDSDMDIACISYFPDYENSPEESFILLDCKDPEKLLFTSLILPGSAIGKWLVADRRDYDGDGDIDIALGSNLIMTKKVPANIQETWGARPITFLLLTNQTIP